MNYVAMACGALLCVALLIILIAVIFAKSPVYGTERDVDFIQKAFEEDTPERNKDE